MNRPIKNKTFLPFPAPNFTVKIVILFITGLFLSHGRLLSVWAQDCPVSLFVRGDVNGDRKINFTDPVSLLGQYVPPCLKAADADDNGQVDVPDALFLIRHLFLGGQKPSSPFPAPGQDLTADTLTCETPFKFMTFSKTIAEEFNSARITTGAIQTDDGGYFIGGFISRGGPLYDMAFRKVNEDATATAWVTEPTEGVDVKIYSIQKTADGGFIAVGHKSTAYQFEFQRTLRQDPWGPTLIYLIKIAPDGHIVWKRELGDASSQWAEEVKEVSDGYVIVGWRHYSGASIRKAIFVLKTDLNGEEVWSKMYPVFHGPCDDGQDNDGDLVVDLNDPGCFLDQDDFDETNAPGVECSDCIDNDQDVNQDDPKSPCAFPPDTGDLQCFGTDDNNERPFIPADSFGRSIEPSLGPAGEPDGFMVLGDAYQNGEPSLILMKIDLNGNEVWSRLINDAQPDELKGYDEATVRGLLRTQDGGYLIYGKFIEGEWDKFRNLIGEQTDHVFLYKVDSSGQKIWSKLYDQSWGFPMGIDKTADGGFILTTQNSKLVKGDENGNIQWERIFLPLDRPIFGLSARPKQTADGGYILAGPAVTPDGIFIFLMKTDPVGCVEK